MSWWKKTHDNKTLIRWEYQKYQIPEITIEAHFDKTLNLWLVYGAQDGKGLPEKASTVITKKEAISYIAMLKYRFEKRGVRALKNVWDKL